MSNLITYPFDIDYVTVSKALTRYGRDAVLKQMTEEWKLDELVAKVIIKRALKNGWGS